MTMGRNRMFDGEDDVFTMEEVNRLLPQILETITGSAVVEIGINSKAEAAIQELVPELTLEGVSSAEPEFLPKIQEILERNILSYPLSLLKKIEELEQLKPVIELVSKRIVEFGLTSEEGKNVKFARMEENEKGLPQQIGLMRFCPPLSQLSVRPVQQQQQKSKGGAKGKQQSQQQTKLNDSKSEDEEPAVQFLAEADLEDKCKKGDDGSGSGGGYQGVRASPSGGGDSAPGADQPALRPVQAAAGNGADAALLHLPGHRPGCGQAV